MIGDEIMPAAAYAPEANKLQGDYGDEICQSDDWILFICEIVHK
jgi:hypothetical protein